VDPPGLLGVADGDVVEEPLPLPMDEPEPEDEPEPDRLPGEADGEVSEPPWVQAVKATPMNSAARAENSFLVMSHLLRHAILHVRCHWPPDQRVQCCSLLRPARALRHDPEVHVMLD
jgi:hypothetical protein